MAEVEKGYALYRVDENRMARGSAFAVCTSREECEKLQRDPAVIREFGPHQTTAVVEVDILTQRDVMGASCHILAEPRGFSLNYLDVRRLKGA